MKFDVPNSLAQSCAIGKSVVKESIDFNDQTFIDQLLAEQRALTAVEKFSRDHSLGTSARENIYRDLIPVRAPKTGEQYAFFQVDLDLCSGCKACVSACHSLNGLDDEEIWRGVGRSDRKSSA